MWAPTPTETRPPRRRSGTIVRALSMANKDEPVFPGWNRTPGLRFWTGGVNRPLVVCGVVFVFTFVYRLLIVAFDTDHFDHLSMDLPDEEALLALRRRLQDFGTEVTDVVEDGPGIERSSVSTGPSVDGDEAMDATVDPLLRPLAFGDVMIDATAYGLDPLDHPVRLAQ